MDPIGRIEGVPEPLEHTDQQQHPSRLAGLQRNVDKQVTSELVNLKAQNMAPAEIHEQVVFSPESSAMLQKVTAPQVDLTTPEAIAVRLKTLVKEHPPNVVAKGIPAEEPQGQPQSETLLLSTPENDKTYTLPHRMLIDLAESSTTLPNPPSAQVPKSTENPGQQVRHESAPGNQPSQPPRNTGAPATQPTVAPSADTDGAVITQPTVPLNNASTNATAPGTQVPTIVVQQAILTEFGSQAPQIPASQFKPLIKDGVMQPEAQFNQPDGLIPARPVSSAALIAVKAASSGLASAVKDPRPARNGATTSEFTERVIKDAVEIAVETPAQQTLAAKALSRLAAAVNEVNGLEAKAGDAAALKILPDPAGQNAPSQNRSLLNAVDGPAFATITPKLPLVESKIQGGAHVLETLARINPDATSRLESRTPGNAPAVATNALPADARQERFGATVLLADLPFAVNSTPPSRAHMRVERFDEQDRGGKQNQSDAPKQTYSLSLELHTPNIGLVKVRLAYTGADLNGTVIFCTSALADQAQERLNDLRSVLGQATGIERPVILMRAEQSGYQPAGNSV
jgi:hypothetical protein